jgi:hypothetical protein
VDDATDGAFSAIVCERDVVRFQPQEKYTKTDRQYSRIKAEIYITCHASPLI